MTQVEICNLALVKIGEPVITSIDENNLRSRLLLTIYEHQKTFCLKLYEWPFALNRITLTNFETENNVYKFDIPSELLKLVSVDAEYMLYGNKIHTKEESITIEYLVSADENDFDSEFIEVFSLKLAIELVIKLNDDEDKKTQLEDSFIEALKNAKYMNSSETNVNEQKFNSFETSRL